MGLVLVALAWGAGCTFAEPTLTADIHADLGEPLPTITVEQWVRFERGRALAGLRFTPSSGLGPEFNAVFCAACHEKPVVGGSASRYRDVFVQATAGSSFEQIGQSQFQITPPRRASDAPGVATATRNPIPLFGVGLLAQIPVDEILRRSDPTDADGDGISGRVNFERGFVGRFGRKAQMASLVGFVRLALLDHFGITTDPVTVEDLALIPGPAGLPTSDVDEVPDPELPAEDVADLITFVATLAVPRPDPPTSETTRGRQLFDSSGCASCHAPFLDGPPGPVPAYTDLLLHDMGPELDDGVAVGEATSSEFRTQPLWGVATVGPYLHDGRADTLDEAIRWHGGEGRRAREAYVALAPDGRESILRFLVSLGGSAFRSDGLLPPDDPVLAAGRSGGPLHPLEGDELRRFARGRALFDRDFAFDRGLGPLFNGDACRSCHFDPVLGGAGPSGVDVIRAAGPDGGAVGFGTMAHRYDSSGARPGVSPDAVVFEARQTPTTLGLGLIDSVDPEAILANADPDDGDGDGVRGRAHILPDGRLGRFGWKANVPTLLDFIRDAFSTELGITVPSDAASSFGQSSDADAVADPELSELDLDDLLFFMQQLAPPSRVPVDPIAEARGQQVFGRIGCATCHVPELPDGDHTPIPLYSDLLLHDVAASSALFVIEGDASREFRTPPLWGVSGSAPYLHDGSAETLVQAILAHDSEALVSRTRYAELVESDREGLVAFLRSL